MPPIKIMTVYGTRPEAIKCASLLKAMDRDSQIISTPVTTGQHREMLDQVNHMFGLTPAHDLNIMKPGQSLNSIVSSTISKLDTLLEDESPDAVVVQGDTSTAMASALAAFNRRIPVIHLEAGLRTGNLASPFPEEGNRKLIGSIAQLHLAPTQGAADNLTREGIPATSIAVTGNTVIDALQLVDDTSVTFSDPRLTDLVHSEAEILMVTTHRRENIGSMAAIAQALTAIAQRFPSLKIALPAHLNPAVRNAILPEIKDQENIIVTDPLPYDQFVTLMKRAKIILTDSGGVQEEAPSLGKPVLVMRNTTERPEAVEAGTVKLVGTEPQAIISGVERLLTDADFFDTMANAVNPYGDGHATPRAVAAMKAHFGYGERLDDFSPSTIPQAPR